MSEDLVIVSVEDRIGRLSFNRPNALNAFSHGLMEAASAALKRLTDDPGVLAIVVSGEGRAFSAGFDLKEGQAQARETLDDCAGEVLPTAWLPLRAPLPDQALPRQPLIA
jgi:enoyl-CoA hydratase/carnithine racemase